MCAHARVCACVYAFVSLNAVNTALQLEADIHSAGCCRPMWSSGVLGSFYLFFLWGAGLGRGKGRVVASQYQQRRCPPARSACPPALASRQRCAASRWPLQPPINQGQLQPLVHRRLSSSRSAGLQSAGSGVQEAGGLAGGGTSKAFSPITAAGAPPPTGGRRRLETWFTSSYEAGRRRHAFIVLLLPLEVSQ